MCSELEPHECHRGYVLGKTLDSDEIAVIHIGRDGEPLSQSQIREDDLSRIAALIPSPSMPATIS